MGLLTEPTFNDFFKMRAILGQGQYGIVLLVQCIYSQDKEEQSAVKVINKARLYPSELEIIRSEADILQKLAGNEHIV